MPRQSHHQPSTNNEIISTPIVRFQPDHPGGRLKSPVSNRSCQPWHGATRQFRLALPGSLGPVSQWSQLAGTAEYAHRFLNVVAAGRIGCGRHTAMRLPRRGEVATYVAKQCDVPFGAEQRQIARLKSGATADETANRLAKLLIKRISQMVYPADDSSPADVVESKLRSVSYRLFANAAMDADFLEFIFRDGANFFRHHSVVAASIAERHRGELSRPDLELEIYLYHFALPVLANNLVKYEMANRWLQLDEGVSGRLDWFLPTVAAGRDDCVTPLAKALSWLRVKLGGKDVLGSFLCPKADPDNAQSEIDRWRVGDVVPSRESIETWAGTYQGDRSEFRKIFHLAATTTRTWRHLTVAFGYPRAIAINAHLLAVMRTLRDARANACGPRPNFSSASDAAKRCLLWLYTGPQSGSVSLGPNYRTLIAEMQASYVAACSPFES